MRRSVVRGFWYGQQQFDRMYPNMKARQGHERKLGHITLRNLVHNESQNRREEDPVRQRSIDMTNLQAAANEQGTGEGRLRNDLSRQAVHLSRDTMIMLAQFEPMAFRSLVELAGSDISPPPRVDPEQLKAPREEGELPPAEADLRYDVRRMLRKCASPTVAPDAAAVKAATEPDGTKQWAESWQEFCVDGEVASKQP